MEFVGECIIRFGALERASCALMMENSRYKTDKGSGKLVCRICEATHKQVDN